MKKRIQTLLSIVFSIFGVFTSCEGNYNESFDGKVVNREVQIIDEKADNREGLIFYSMAENYKLSEEEVYNDLTSFLALNLTNTDNSFVMDSRVACDEKKQFEIKKTKTVSKKLPKYNSSSRSADSVEDVNISVYKIANTVSGNTGLAITTDDERLGSLLCVLEDINYTDEEEDPVFSLFMENLDNYIEDVSNELESITERDYELFKEKYNITDEEIAAAKAEYENSEDRRKFWGYDTWSNWSIVNINLNNLIAKTKWGQRSPYNSAIVAMMGGNYPTGCGTTALAQIMAYHEWPQKYNRGDLNELKSKWTVAKDWNGNYNWKEMKANTNASYVSTEGRICIGALMYEVSKGCDSVYGIDGTSTTMDSRIKYLRSNGYKCDDAKAYSYDGIAKSLNANCPVMVRGTSNAGGHAWIIDGALKLKRTRNYYVFWIPFTCSESQEYVHCNYGWNGSSDEGSDYTYTGVGYYKSGVFASGLNDSLRICTNIRPNN